jgi:hypothetical protein
MSYNLKIGQAGVHAVISQLMLRGHDAWLPVSDDHGVDVKVDDGVRIQVKTSSIRYRKPWPTGHYSFSFHKQTYRAGNRIVSLRRDTAAECDFVILWGIEQNRFWIIPSGVVKDRRSVMFSANPETAYVRVDIEAVNRLVECGMSLPDAAKQMNVPLTTLWRRMTTGVNAPKGAWGKTATMYARYEGCWDQLKGIETIPAQAGTMSKTMVTARTRAALVGTSGAGNEKVRVMTAS